MWVYAGQYAKIYIHRWRQILWYWKSIEGDRWTWWIWKWIYIGDCGRRAEGGGAEHTVYTSVNNYILNPFMCSYNFKLLHLHYCVTVGSPADDSIPAKILSYNRANRAVAILCNHQRAPPKTFEKSMQNLQTKVNPCVVHLCSVLLTHHK